MENLEIKFIPPENMLSILPLLQKLNNFTDEAILKERVIAMRKLPQYQCVGMYLHGELIGISGLWFIMRHYCGKTLEPDHVIISEQYRNKGYGRKLFEWIHRYAQETGCEAAELNTYIANVKSHQFYENEGYKKLGFHYVKIF